MTNKNELVFDPFAGVSSAGVAAIIHNRVFWGCEIIDEYINISKERLQESLKGTIKYRPFNQPIYDSTKSKLSKRPQEWTVAQDDESFNNSTGEEDGLL